MKNIKVVKIISVCLTLAGAAIGLASNFLGDKLLDNKIETKVSEALSKNK